MKISQFFPLVLGTLMFLLPNCAGETDTQLYYKEEGEGETIIFVHGLQEDYRVFLPQLEALKKSYRVVTYSRRYNHPNRYRYHASHTFNVFTEAEDLAFLVDELETTSVHLVGHSLQPGILCRCLNVLTRHYCNGCRKRSTSIFPVSRTTCG